MGLTKSKRDRSWESSPNGLASARNWYHKSPKAMFSLYKKSSKKRNLIFDISIEDFTKLILLPCVYCGTEATQTPSLRNGLDRVNNSLGYVLNNVVSCCFKCNQMKGKLTKEEFLNHIRRISDYAT